MFLNPSVKLHFLFLAFIITAFFSGCATRILPNDLARPEALTCIEVPEGVEAHEIKGPLKKHWTTKLVPGPYISEREDADGTYYRAPPGGIYSVLDEIADKPTPPLMPRIFDGGIWVPRTSGKTPHLYIYYSTQDATIIPLPDSSNCSSAVSVPDPESMGVNTVAFVTGGALGGATGGATARATVPNASVSYGQATGGGAIAGAVSGLIVAGLINMDVGKITHLSLSTDPKFVAALEELALKVVPIPAIQPQTDELPTKLPETFD